MMTCLHTPRRDNVIQTIYTIPSIDSNHGLIRKRKSSRSKIKSNTVCYSASYGWPRTSDEGSIINNRWSLKMSRLIATARLAMDIDLFDTHLLQRPTFGSLIAQPHWLLGSHSQYLTSPTISLTPCNTPSRSFRPFQTCFYRAALDIPNSETHEKRHRRRSIEQTRLYCLELFFLRFKLLGHSIVWEYCTPVFTSRSRDHLPAVCHEWLLPPGEPSRFSARSAARRSPPGRVSRVAASALRWTQYAL